MCWYELHPPHLINAATLACESQKNRKCMWTQLQLLTLTTQPLHASNYIDSFIKCSGASYKWTFMSQRVFKVSTTSMHTWSQMVTLASMMFWSKSKQVCINRFHRSSMSRIFTVKLWIETRAVISRVTATTAFLMRQLIVASRLGRTEYQLLLMKISWW